jgi:hypothetical protein
MGLAALVILKGVVIGLQLTWKDIAIACHAIQFARSALIMRQCFVNARFRLLLFSLLEFNCTNASRPALTHKGLKRDGFNRI